MQDTVFTGYYPGAIGDVTRLHAVYYAEHWGFDLSFESQVARELAEFLCRQRPERDMFLAARSPDGGLRGALAIDGLLTGTEGARLRWFIVSQASQGTGLGGVMLDRALHFARRAGHRRIFLWTFRGLEAARTLYERAGFRLDLEESLPKWGGAIHEQRYVLDF